MPQSEIEEAFDAALAEIRERELAGERIAPPEHAVPAEVAEAGAALRAIFEGNHHLTADLSFDQVYAMVQPHLITIWKHIMREREARSDPDGES